jgi:4-hydroxybenzoate polyprenyltransferase
MGTSSLRTTVKFGLRAAPHRLPWALVLEAMRPRQWTKNLLVLAGVIFAGRMFDPGAVVAAIVVTVAFCAASGAAYLFNDVRDAVADRLNPRTAARPIARGALGSGAALRAAVLAGIFALALASAVDWRSGVTVACFLALQFGYSLVLKHLVVIDVLAIAAGFSLRALGGTAAVDTRLSAWLLLCTALLAALLALTKRRAELLVPSGARIVLRRYSLQRVDWVIGVLMPTIVLVYLLYALLGAASDAMLLTAPFVVFGLLRLRRMTRERPTLTEDPSVALWSDPALVACIGLWGACAGAVAVLTA